MLASEKLQEIFRAVNESSVILNKVHVKFEEFLKTRSKNIEAKEYLRRLSRVIAYGGLLYKHRMWSYATCMSNSMFVCDEELHAGKGYSGGGPIDYIRKKINRNNNTPRYIAHFLLVVRKFAIAMKLESCQMFINNIFHNGSTNLANKSFVKGRDTMDNDILHMLESFIVGKDMVTASVLSSGDIEFLHEKLSSVLRNYLSLTDTWVLGKYQHPRDKLYATMSMVALRVNTTTIYNPARRRLVEMALFIQIHHDKFNENVNINWFDSDFFRISGYFIPFVNVYPELLNVPDNSFVVDISKRNVYGTLLTFVTPPLVDKVFANDSHKMMWILTLLAGIAINVAIGNFIDILISVFLNVVDRLYFKAFNKEGDTLHNLQKWFVAKYGNFLHSSAKRKINNKITKFVSPTNKPLNPLQISKRERKIQSIVERTGNNMSHDAPDDIGKRFEKLIQKGNLKNDACRSFLTRFSRALTYGSYLYDKRMASFVHCMSDGMFLASEYDDSFDDINTLTGGGPLDFIKKRLKSKSNAPRYIAHFLLITKKFATAMDLVQTINFIDENLGQTIQNTDTNKSATGNATKNLQLDSDIESLLQKYFVGTGRLSHRVSLGMNEVKFISQEMAKMLQAHLPSTQIHLYQKLLSRYDRVQDRLYATMSLIALTHEYRGLSYNRSRRRLVEMAIYIQMDHQNKKHNKYLNWYESEFYRICGKLQAFNNLFPSLLQKKDGLFVVDAERCSKYGLLLTIVRAPMIDRLFSINANKMSVILQLIFVVLRFDIGKIISTLQNVMMIFAEALFIDSIEHDGKILNKFINTIQNKLHQVSYKSSERSLINKVQKFTSVKSNK